MKMPKDLTVLSGEAQRALRAAHDREKRENFWLRVQCRIEGASLATALIILLGILIMAGTAKAEVPTSESYLHRTDAGDQHFIHAVPEIVVEQEVVFDDKIVGALSNNHDGFIWGDHFLFEDGHQPECVTGKDGHMTFKLAGPLLRPLSINTGQRIPGTGYATTWQYPLSGQTQGAGRFPVSITGVFGPGGAEARGVSPCWEQGHGGWVIKFPHEVTAFSVQYIVNSAVSGGRGCEIHHTEEAPQRVHMRAVNFDGEVIGHMDLAHHHFETTCLITASFVSEVPVGGLEFWAQGLENIGFKSVAIGTAALPEPEPEPEPQPDPEIEELRARIAELEAQLAAALAQADAAEAAVRTLERKLDDIVSIINR